MSTVRAPRVEPSRARTATPRPELRVVDDVVARRNPTPGKVGVVVGVFTFVVLFALAGLHVLLVNGQAEIDDLNARIATEQSRERDLTLQLAEMRSPERVNVAARDRLGMVQPGVVGFLTPRSDDDSRASLDGSADDTLMSASSAISTSSATSTSSAGIKGR